MSDAPELQTRPHRSHLPWLDLVISVCALFMSGVSIFMANENSNSMQDLVHANSWPFLQLDSGNTSDDGLTHVLEFAVSNAGVGPARIYSSEFLVDGRPVSNRDFFANLARGCCASEYNALVASAPNDPYAAIGSVMSNNVAPKVLAARDNVTALRWTRTERNAALWSAFDQARQHGRITMRTCYCSVFNECWIGESGRLPTPSPRACTEQQSLFSLRH